ncbi:uncharacterized protein OCT59_028649 [Rhizophagus irregularis]|uniref:uncharacterized protein n=1 Tax=Rhizophagus irregularis TaxID=588596 RepID=UPI001A032B34|nr:hypothetical protein OCT59_028649 [Rhizophagus irregularis]GBC52752.2 hypothetical protein GLOIN_2v205859 [Rhizophagus irregularis DAOM 181602=DAOM 197198]
MDRTNYYSGLNPIVVQALNNLQYRYSGEMPEMWCSRVRYPFKKLLEYNPKYFSKNGFIQMVERVYIDGEFKAGRCSLHIYCTVCDSLVIIRENTIECGNDHLKKCIARTAKRRSTSIQKNTKKEIEEIYLTYCFKFSKGLSIYSYADDYETWKKHVNHLIDTVKVVQRAWRAFKLRPETWAKRVWNMVRNDGTPDKKKFLSPRGKRDIYDPYVWYIDQKILAKDLPESFLNNLYDGHIPREWAEKKSDQLHNRLGNIAYIVAFIVLHQQGYRIVTYGDWSYMLKWLSNPEYYRINEYYNNGNVNFVKSSEYARYRCKITGKPYPCDSLEIDYFKSEYGFTIEGKFNIIDFSDSNNNCEYVCRVFRAIDSLSK